MNILIIPMIIPTYNLIGYSDFYSDTSGSLWKFRSWDESTVNEDGDPDNVSTNNPTSFKCKSSFLGESTSVDNNRVFKNVKIAAQLKYLSNF